jgi:hypothetical protein
MSIDSVTAHRNATGLGFGNGLPAVDSTGRTWLMELTDTSANVVAFVPTYGWLLSIDLEKRQSDWKIGRVAFLQWEGHQLADP